MGDAARTAAIATIIMRSILQVMIAPPALSDTATIHPKGLHLPLEGGGGERQRASRWGAAMTQTNSEAAVAEPAIFVAAAGIGLRRTQDLRWGRRPAVAGGNFLQQWVRLKLSERLLDLAFVLGNLQHELVPHGGAEILESLHHHEKRAFSGDDTGGVISVEIGNIAFRVLIHDGKAVDGDAVVRGRIVNVLQGDAVIVGTVARYVDHLARGGDFPVAFVEHQRGAFERPADRGARAGGSRNATNFFGEGRGARLILHEGPIEHDPVIVGA